MPQLSQQNLRSVVSSFKDAMERDRKPAPEAFRTEALTGMWNFAPVRQDIKREVAALAAYFRTDADPPSDFVPRIGRLAIAMYLLDKMQEIAEAASKNRHVSAVALFDMARRGAESVLDRDYFSKSPERIMHDYLEAEPSIVSCGSAFNVRTLSLADAVKEYKMKAAQAVEDELGPR